MSFRGRDGWGVCWSVCPRRHLYFLNPCSSDRNDDVEWRVAAEENKHE